MELLSSIVRDYGIIAAIAIVALIILIKSQIEINIKYGGKKEPNGKEVG